MKNIEGPESVNFLHPTAQFTHAIDYARQVHVNYRKGTIVPYTAHLIGVASLVMGESWHVPFRISLGNAGARQLRLSSRAESDARRGDFVPDGLSCSDNSRPSNNLGAWKDSIRMERVSNCEFDVHF